MKAVLEAIKSNPIIPVVTGGDTTLMNHQQLSAYADALASDPVRRVRELVGACRKSGERRDDLRRVIKHGNAGNLWGQNMTVPELQLLRDCDTRWSSTYQMIGRAITLYPVSLHQYEASYVLSDPDIALLTGHQDVLEQRRPS